MSDLKLPVFPRLEFSARSLSDLEEIWVYFSEQNESSANKILKQITDKCSQLLEFPKAGRERNDLLLNLRSIPTGKFIIFYQEMDFGIEVIRILHGSQNIEYLFDEMIPLEP